MQPASAFAVQPKAHGVVRKGIVEPAARPLPVLARVLELARVFSEWQLPHVNTGCLRHYTELAIKVY